jgi:hypothetical protein
LSKENRFNLTGELTVEMIDGKQNYKLVALHPNRTIEWTSVYSSTDKKTLQSSKIELAKDVWLGYEIEVSNHTQDDVESQQIVLKVSYPARDVTVRGLYLSKEDSFDTDLTVEWLKNNLSENDEKSDEENQEITEPKIVQASLKWQDLEKNEVAKDHQNIMLLLKHPSFEKDVTLQVNFIKF